MKVEVDIKITVLDGEEKGQIFTKKSIENTNTQYTEYGIIDRLIFEWNQMRPIKYLRKDEVYE